MPGTPTQPDGLRFPVETDSPDVPRDLAWLAQDTQDALKRRDQKILQGVPIFENAADRDAQLAAAGVTPTEGMIAYMKDSNLLVLYNGSSWGALSTVKYSGRAKTTSTGSIPVGNVDPLEGFVAESQTNLPMGWAPMSVSSGGVTIPVSGVYAAHMAVVLQMDSGSNAWGMLCEPIVNGTRPDYIRGALEYGVGTVPNVGAAAQETSNHWNVYVNAGDVLGMQIAVSHGVTTFYNAVMQVVGPV